MEDLGHPVSYLVAEKGISVFSSDGQKLGRVVKVQASPEANMFDGIVFDTTRGPGGHRFVDAPEVEAIYERGRGAEDRRDRGRFPAQAATLNGFSRRMPPMQRLLLIIVACLALVAAGCGSDSSTSTDASTDTAQTETSPSEEGSTGEEETSEEDKPDLPEVSVPKGPPPKKLVIEDVKKGSGKTAKAGDEVSVEYIGVALQDG